MAARGTGSPGKESKTRTRQRSAAAFMPRDRSQRASDQADRQSHGSSRTDWRRILPISPSSATSSMRRAKTSGERPSDEGSAATARKADRRASTPSSRTALATCAASSPEDSGKSGRGSQSFAASPGRAGGSTGMSPKERNATAGSGSPPRRVRIRPRTCRDISSAERNLPSGSGCVARASSAAMPGSASGSDTSSATSRPPPGGVATRRRATKPGGAFPCSTATGLPRRSRACDRRSQGGRGSPDGPAKRTSPINSPSPPSPISSGWTTRFT